tara:strand:+ start:49 stop:570 length:522 start_codon:yes stop_codon:yes gene_type:complete
MSLPFMAIPYIITGTASLYFSYQTYNSYYNNLEFIELERDNKLKNEEEAELQKKFNEDSYVSIDSEKNLSIESISEVTDSKFIPSLETIPEELSKKKETPIKHEETKLTKKEEENKQPNKEEKETQQPNKENEPVPELEDDLEEPEELNANNISKKKKVKKPRKRNRKKRNGK